MNDNRTLEEMEAGFRKMAEFIEEHTEPAQKKKPIEMSEGDAILYALQHMGDHDNNPAGNRAYRRKMKKHAKRAERKGYRGLLDKASEGGWRRHS